MRIQFHQCLSFALGMCCLPALAAGQSYLPLPETGAPVYRPVSSSYYEAEPDGAATGSSLISRMAEPPAPENTVPSPDDEGDEAESASSTVAGKACGKGCGLGHCFGGCGCWYGGAYGIYFERDREREMQITVFDTNERDAILSNRSAEMDATWGGQFTIGRYLHCGTCAAEVTYWELDPDSEQATVLDPNDIATAPNLLTSFDLSTLNYDDGLGGGVSAIGDWFDGARAHRLTRDYEFRNLELNFIHHTCCGTCSGWGGLSKCGQAKCGKGCAGKCGKANCCRRYEISLLAGVRYLNFDENFLFESDDADTTFDGAAEEVRYSIDVDNQLLGFQLGCRGDYYCSHKLGLHLSSKFGIYGNDIEHHSFIGGSNGAAVVGAGPNAGRAFDIESEKTDVAFLGEMDLGASYCLGCHWRLRAGYRVIAISGIALTTEQVPVYFQDIDGVANIDSECSLVLHGGYAGVELNY